MDKNSISFIRGATSPATAATTNASANADLPAVPTGKVWTVSYVRMKASVGVDNRMDLLQVLAAAVNISETQTDNDIITTAAHGLVVGDIVVIDNHTGATVPNINNIYAVSLVPDTTTFRIREMSSSTDVDITTGELADSGTVTKVGWLWRGEDSFNPAPTNERTIDALERWMNGWVLEAGDILRARIKTTASVAKTGSLIAWVNERDA